MRRTVDDATVARALELWLDGVPRRTIARRLGAPSNRLLGTANDFIKAHAPPSVLRQALEQRARVANDWNEVLAHYGAQPPSSREVTADDIQLRDIPNYIEVARLAVQRFREAQNDAR